VLFLHRIGDKKFSQTADRVSAVLKNLCGDNEMSRLTLCATMLDTVREEGGQEHFDELCKMDAWKEMISRGATTAMISNVSPNAKQAAEKIVTQLIKNMKPVDLAIQDEMVNRKLTVATTSAGKMFDAHKRELQAETKREPKESRDSQRVDYEADAVNVQDKICAQDEESASLQPSVFMAALLAAVQSTARIRGEDSVSGHMAS